MHRQLKLQQKTKPKFDALPPLISPDTVLQNTSQGDDSSLQGK